MTDLNDFFYVDGTDDVMAAYVNNLLAATLRSEYKNIETLSATRELADADVPILRFDCGGANRNVLLPVADLVDNHPFLMVNASDGGEVITLRNNGNTTTLASVAQGEALMMLPDGAGGYVLIEPNQYLQKSGLSVWDEQASDPSTPASGKWKLYFKSGGLYTIDDAGTVSGPLGTGSGGGGDKYPMEARLTLETGVPLSTTNQLAKTTLYLTKYKGDQIAVYSGSAWSNLTLGSDISISLSGLGRSQAYTNDPAAGSNIALNMTNTAGFIVGDIVKVSSSAGSEEATITVVTTNTSITVDVLALNHTTSSPLVTGKLPYDVYVYNNAGSPALELVAWTNRTTRATALTTQNGVKVKTGDTTRRYVGVISTTLTLGQCEFMVSGGTTVTQKILLQNYYNKLPAPIFVAETTDTWNWTTVAWRQLNGSKYNQFDFIDGDGEMLINVLLTYESYTTSGALDAYGAFGLDQAATVSSATVAHVSAAVNTNSIGYAVYNNVVAVGGHYLTLMEYGRAAMVVIGDAGLKRTGAAGIFWC